MKQLSLVLMLIFGLAALVTISEMAGCQDDPMPPPPADYAQCRDFAYRGVVEKCDVFDDWECNRHLREALKSCRYAFPDTAPALPEGLLKLEKDD